MPLISVTSDEDGLVLNWRVASERDRTWATITDPAWTAKWLGRVIDGNLAAADHVVIDHGDGYLCRSTVLHRDPLEMWSSPGNFMTSQLLRSESVSKSRRNRP